MRTEKFYFGAALCDPAVAGKKNILIFCLAIPDEHWPLVVKEGENDLGCQVRYLLNYSNCVVSASRISVIFVFFLTILVLSHYHYHALSPLVFLWNCYRF